MKQSENRHLLRRLTFAASPEAERSFAANATAGDMFQRLWQQSKQTQLPKAPLFAQTPWKNSVLRYEDTKEAEFNAMRNEASRTNARDAEALRQWWIAEFIANPTPLRENLVLFFHSVLGGSSRTVDIPHALYGYNALLREHCLGTIPDLLEALVLDPAMMIQETYDETRRELPSEFSARRILDKWTMGTGTYTDADAENLARAITGWVLDAAPGQAPQRKVDQRGNRANRRTGLTPTLHEDYFDNKPKTILGVTKNFSAKDAVRLLALQDATARRYSRLLICYFGVEDPAHRLEQQMAATYRATSGSMEALLRDIVTSNQFWSDATRWSLIKSPVHLVAGACRQLDIHDAPLGVISEWLTQCGQRLFDTPESGAEGWPGQEAWLKPAGRLAARYELGTAIFGGASAWGLKPVSVSTSTSPLSAAIQRLDVSNLVSRLDPAPGFSAKQTQKRADQREIIHQVLASPEYQLA